MNAKQKLQTLFFSLLAFAKWLGADFVSTLGDLKTNTRGDMVTSIMGMIFVAFVLGGVGIEAIGLISNATLWTAAGVDATVAIIGYSLIPTAMLLGIAYRTYKQSAGRR